MSWAVRGTRAGVSGGRRLVGRLGRYIDESDDAARAAARGGDEATDSGKSAARWWATRGAGAAGAAGAGGLAWRQQDVWRDQASAREAEAYADMSQFQADAATATNGNSGSDDGTETDPKPLLEKLRDAIPGVETIQDTIVVLIVLAIVLHFVLNRSNALPNSPVVIAGGDR
ncbi:hypothetical protein ACFOZ7_05590 [Natribaculum luteum]|uniref:Uncharacterized protein n=1 Tax=Natribaculum luteum TaxID=1586232 RepID=A0ABD5NWK3_9EURY|nr:hypothetical protein [Natribaculum luteum]